MKKNQQKQLIEEKPIEKIAGFLTFDEMKEVRYSVRKELAWKLSQLDQLGKGLINNMDKDHIPKEITDKEVTQEDWLNEKIRILSSIEAKFKTLMRYNKSEKVTSKMDKPEL